VALNWLLDSVNAFGCLDPSKYVPNMGPPYSFASGGAVSTASGWPSTSVVQRLGHFFPSLNSNSPRQQSFQTTFLRSGSTPVAGKRMVSFSGYSNAGGPQSQSQSQAELREQALPLKRQKLLCETEQLISIPEPGIKPGKHLSSHFVPLPAVVSFFCS
jgi:hypothetical protein